MKIQNLAVIFIVIIIPVILVFSYYLSFHTDTIRLQTSYTKKHLEATKQAIEAFEINTVEWNDDFNSVGDTKRRNVMGSINTFVTAFANGIGIGGTSKQDLLEYIPAIACTLYDGYYIYSPTEIKEIIKDKDGKAIFMTEDIANSIGIEYNQENNGKILYKCETGTYTYNGQTFTLDSEKAKTTYSHILKPVSAYSARYKTDDNNIDITVNYTLDNYITIYGIVDEDGYVEKSGYLIDIENIPNNVEPETLSEQIWYQGIDEEKLKNGFNYIYAEDNTKVYFDENIAFTVSSTGVRTDLGTGTTKVKYKELKQGDDICYQALNSYDFNSDGEIKVENDIVQGMWYTKKDDISTIDYTITSYGLKEDVSAINYFNEAKTFTLWVEDKLEKVKVNNIQDVEEDDKLLYGNETDKIFDIGNGIFENHKREVIKQCLISNLNQAITSYSRKVPGEYKLPILKETEWDLVVNNVSIITFVQNIPIGLKTYNNYAISTSTSNKEYVNPDGIYLSSTEGYYHMPYCEHLGNENIIGYRNTDYVIRSYEIEDDSGVKTTYYYYKHSNLANQKCYYCLIQPNLYEEGSSPEKIKAYQTALARERYATHKFR